MDWGVSSAIAPGDNYRIQVQVLNADGSILAQTFGGYFRVVASTQTSAPLSITTSSPIPNAKVGQSYSTNLVATGGTSGTPYTWSLSTSAGGTSLPNGMSLSQTGTISGTPTIAGTYFFYVICSSGSQNIQRPFTLTVDPATVVASGPSLTITTPNGGEVVHYGDRLPIKWSQTGFTVNSSPHVDVYISPQDGRGDIIIGTNISVFDGSSGLVAGIDKQRVVNGVTYTLPFTPGTYKAKIVCQASNIAEFRGCSDVSDAVFTIVDTTTALNTSGSAVLGAESFHFTQFLSEGSQGNEVKELQKYLNDRGYGAGNVDGNFGSQVKDALMRFQTDNGLKSDGIVGYEVRTWLNK
jgi:hypothetical protein